MIWGAISHADINSFAILALLLVMLLFGNNFVRRIRRTSLHGYYNTRAKIKAIEYAPSAIITIDVDGNIVAWSGAASAMFGYKEAQVIGKSLTLIIPDRYKEKHIQAIKTAKETEKYSLIGKTTDLEAINKDGKEFPVRLTLWMWKDGTTIFYTGIVRDITEEKAMQSRITQLLDMYYRAEEIDDSGVWSWDILNDIVYTSKGFDQIYDLEERDKKSSGFILKRVYYEDTPKVEKQIKDIFEKKEDYTFSHRIVTRDGKVVHVEISGEPKCNEKGELISVIGTIHKL